MGKTFNLHQAFQLHGAGLGDAAQVVAAQVHQHHVFRALLRVLQQVGGQCGVFLIVPAALARPGNGGELELAVRAPHHQFRGGAEQRHFRQPHEEHVRGGIDAAHAAVQREGVTVELRGGLGGKHHLDGFSVMEQFLDMLHALHVARLVRRAGNLPDGRFFRLLKGRVGQVPVFAQADLGEAVVQMVKHDHCARQYQAGFRGRGTDGLRQLGLEQGGGFIPEVAVQSPRDGSLPHVVPHQFQTLHQGAQAVQVKHAFQLLQGSQAVVADGKGKPGVHAGNGHQVIAGDDAVAAPSTIHLRALQQKAGSLVLGQAQEQADGRLQIGAQPPAALLEGDDGWWLHGWMMV